MGENTGGDGFQARAEARPEAIAAGAPKEPGFGRAAILLRAETGKQVR